MTIDYDWTDAENWPNLTIDEALKSHGDQMIERLERELTDDPDSDTVSTPDEGSTND